MARIVKKKCTGSEVAADVANTSISAYDALNICEPCQTDEMLSGYKK